MIDYELSLFGTNSVRIVPSSIGFIPDIYEAEVKNMQWGKTAPVTNQITTIPPIFNTNNLSYQNQQNNFVSNNYNSYKEKLKTGGNYANNINNSIQPVVGNAIPKFSRNPDLANTAGSTKSDVPNVDPKFSNKSNYTTTYRSSYQYQKP